MITIEFTPEEAEMLRFVLESYRTDLRGEIRETDSYAFREQLREREQFLHKLLTMLPAAPEEKPI